jgi:uncharacterized protein (UPF0332 family)
MRERADYDVYYKATKDEAESAIRYSERFVERIKKALDEVESDLYENTCHRWFGLYRKQLHKIHFEQIPRY